MSNTVLLLRQWRCLAAAVVVSASAAAQPVPIPALPAPGSAAITVVSAQPSRHALAVPVDDFESYAPGPLPNAGGWYVPSPGGDAAIVAAGIDGRSLRVYGTPQAAFTWSAGRVFDAAPGVLAVDVVLPPVQTFFLFSPFSDTGPVSGLLTPHLTLAVGPQRIGYVFQRFDAQRGEYVRLNTAFAPGQRARLAWDVRADGCVLLYRDGRLLFEGRSEAQVYEGSPRPLGAFLAGSGNGVPRDDAGASNVLTLDNLGASLPVLPPDTAADLVALASLSDAGPAAPVVGRREVVPGGSVPLLLTLRNPSTFATADASLGGTLPAGYTIGGSACGVTQTGTEWRTAPQVLPAGGEVRCPLRLTLARGIPPGEGRDIPLNALPIDGDAYPDSNTAWVTVFAGVFGDGFEPP